MDRPRLKDIFHWAIRRKKRFVIEGPSMKPTLNPGDQVLVDVKKHLRQSLRPSEIVLFRQINSDLLMVKRIVAIEKNALNLRGDNEGQSTDSRDFGLVPIDNVIGVVCSKISN